MTYEDLSFDEERALYGLKDAQIRNCRFAGPADGESALKECRNLLVQNCDFSLRYPLWHAGNAEITDCTMADTCRAALWYDKDITLTDCRFNGIKALRECERVIMDRCAVHSPEFGWFCRHLAMEDCRLAGEYPFMKSSHLELSHLNLQGKYSFQYVENAVIEHSVLDTKDAFWHSKNVTVIDSVINGEYLAWYSEGLKLIRCKIKGTQPLCYARGLILEDCEMEETDLSFEYSEARASIKGNIVSVKNPKNGRIEADSIGRIILDEYRIPGESCEIILRSSS